MNYSQVAEAMASDLAGARVDPNEAQKALAYLRGKRDPKRFFDYLQAVVSNGQAVIRSRQTLDYYRALQQICQRHLRGMEYEEMALTLGWALRLLRYYRAVPEAVQRQAAAAALPARRDTVPSEPTPPEERRDTVSPNAKVEPNIPAVGTVFRGKIMEMDASLAVIEVEGFAEAQAVALLSADVADLKRYKVGNTAWVEVTELKTQRSGRVLVIVKPAPRPKDGPA